MFCIVVGVLPPPRPGRLRWPLTDDDGDHPRLPGVVRSVPGRDELAGLELLHVRSKRVLNRVPDRSGMPFRWTVNPYRGCTHACVYCFARPSHEYLGLNGGRDFERRIVIKVNAVECLRRELARPSWCGESVALGTNTDPYQPVEGRYRLTRGILEVLSETGNPFSVLTKSTLIRRDLDVLVDAAARTQVSTALSVGCLDTDVWRRTEPHTPAPRRRLEAVQALSRAGVPSGVVMAPILPGISDGPDQMEELVRAAIDAGARWISPIALHLRPGVRSHYLGWLREASPSRWRATRRRYGRSAYLPAQESRALSDYVAELVDRLGGGTVGVREMDPATPGPEASVPVAAGAPDPQRQLRLV